MTTAIEKSAGRPKVSPSDLCLRRIGKSFEAADQLLAVHKANDSELREKGRGKQPFNSYIKSLQEKIAMYDSYLELLSISADEAGYEIDADVILTDEDKEQPWAKLKDHYRDSENKTLSLNKEFKERSKVFNGSREDYNSSYPFIEWCSFWFESELNAAQRLAGQAIMSFDLLGVEFFSLDEALVTLQAKKGRETFKNKQGKNTKGEFAVMHSKIVRYKNRLRKALDEIGYSEEQFDNLDITDMISTQDKSSGKLLKQVHNLHTTIEVMESELNKKLHKASREQALNFKFTLVKKKLLPFTKKTNAGKITPLEKVKMANILQEIESIKGMIEEVKAKTQEAKAA